MLRDIPVKVIALLLLADQSAGDVCDVKLSTMLVLIQASDFFVLLVLLKVKTPLYLNQH